MNENKDKEWLQKATEEYGAPANLRSDNGPEFIGAVDGLKDNDVRTRYIEPGRMVSWKHPAL